jgi:hypothetical protein
MGIIALGVAMQQTGEEENRSPGDEPKPRLKQDRRRHHVEQVLTRLLIKRKLSYKGAFRRYADVQPEERE